MALVRPYTLLTTTNPTSPSVLHESHMFPPKILRPPPPQDKK